MTQTKPRLSWLVLAIIAVLVMVPHVARADDEYYSDDGSYSESSTGGYLVGVDVSEWNGTIDWELVQQDGVDYAILRCGGSYEWSSECYGDEQFLRNALECERLGIPYGVYFYSTATSTDEALIEAQFVLNQLWGLSPSLPVFVDLEWEQLNSVEYAPLVSDVANTFCACMSYAGYQPGVYASAAWWEYMLTDDCFDWYGKWVAQYESYCDCADADWWQYSSQGIVSGIDWPVDMNIWYV